MSAASRLRAAGLLLACMMLFLPAEGRTTETGTSPSADSLAGDPFAGDESFSTLFAAKQPEQEPDDKIQLQNDLHGYLESRDRFRVDDSKWISTRQRLWLEMDSVFRRHAAPGAGQLYSVFISGAVDLEPAAADLSGDNDPARIYIEEAFLTIDQAQWDLIVGQKTLRTGTGDGINPMDLVNPLDHRDPVANGRSDSRLPIPLAFASLQLPRYGGVQEACIEAVFIPLAGVNRMNASGSAWESPGVAALRRGAAAGEFVLEKQEEPNQYFEQAEYSLRLAATFSGWDVGLIGFAGYKDSPVFSTGSVQIQGKEKLALTPVHPGFSAMGLTFAKGFERSTLRGELAWKPDLPLTASSLDYASGFLRRSVNEGVIGIDRTLGVNLYTNVQYFFICTDDAELTVNDSFDHGITYEVNDTFFNDDLKSGVRGIVSFSGEGWTFEAYAQYQRFDNWLISLSLLFYEGPEDGSYGAYDANDALTLRLRYSF
ncbi:MAG: hypothetical protein CSA31_01305 [Desulfobulbus propionicus]|nr:MAG: hypothetical protein CSA31_01305 [Desulfobulbus propionicus]